MKIRKEDILKEARRTTWKEYVQGLDLSHWEWVNTYPWRDRKVVFVSEELIIYPVYPEDILEDENVNYEFVDDGLAISWDNFKKDCTVLTVLPDDNIQEPIGYIVLVAKDEGKWKLKVNKVFTELNEVYEYFKN